MAAVQSRTGEQVATTSSPAAQETVDVLVYSDDRETRRVIIDSVGRRAGKGLPLLRWTEAATHAGVLERIAETDYAVVVLDGEASKVGGMAIARELKTTLFECPPLLLTIARPQDQWLAMWSEVDAVVSEPLDPVELQEAIAGLLRGRADVVAAEQTR